MDTSAFLIALAVVYLVPGPDMLLLFQTGARQGRRAALVTALGLALARACHVLMAATGLALLFRTAPWTFDLVRLLGAAYLACLACRCCAVADWPCRPATRVPRRWSLTPTAGPCCADS